jgi:glutathione S-transferase
LPGVQIAISSAPAADDEMKVQAQQERSLRSRSARRLSRLLHGRQRFIGGDSASIADIRLIATPEFLRVIDYDSRPGRTST